MIYCPGHVGVRGNERADALARKATVDGTVMIRDKIDLIKAMTVTFQNEEEGECDSVCVQRMIGMIVTRGKGRKSCLGGKA